MSFLELPDASKVLFYVDGKDLVVVSERCRVAGLLCWWVLGGSASRTKQGM